MARRKNGSIGGISILPDNDTDGIAGDPIDAVGGIAIIDPPTDPIADTGTSGDANNSGDTPKRRGRKPGSKNSVNTGARDSKTEIDLIDGGLIIMHTLAASLLSMPELSISDEKRNKLASALHKVNALYDPKVSKEVIAWVNLAFVAGTIYVPIAIDIKRRMDKESTTQESFAFPPVMQFPVPA